MPEIITGPALIGVVGLVFGRLIQAAVSRQREYFADSSDVQFTRDPSGISGSLKKIFACSQHVRFESVDP